MKHEDPFYNGIPADIEERARLWIWDRYGEEFPTESLLLDISYGIYEDDIRKCQEDREILKAQHHLDGGL